MPVTYHSETWQDLARDENGLFEMHYNELSLNKDRIKLAPHHERYLEMQAAGALHVATIRDNGKLVGYFVTFLLPHLHYKDSGTMAYTDMYFVHHDYRRGQIGLRLFLFVEDCWKCLGVVKAYVSHKVHLDLEPMMTALGWTLSDKMYTKMVS